ncbi:LPD7 domain-containing protein [Saccharibacter floricola]|uniref:LPD7 domain-containing protein n=1 Tax=Saccharibacter floricola TaxID=231053 RepID=UPI003571365D
MKNVEQFRDYGDRMTCLPDPIQPATALGIVLSAVTKRWTAIELTGSQEFKDEIATYARINSIAYNHKLSESTRRQLDMIIKEEE